MEVRGLAGQALLDVWERGLALHPVDRALAILAAACPDASWPALAALSIGRRDALLFRTRARTFGPGLAARAACPVCEEQLELRLETADLGLPLEGAGGDDADDEPAGGPASHLAQLDELEARFRLPDSRDLAAAAAAADPEAARALLLQRCVLAVSDRRDGTVRSIEALSPAGVEALAARMAEADPHAEVALAVTCPRCAHRWRVDLDIGSYFWTEIVAEARRLLREVDALARVYGWRELDILAMSATRRQAYLELAAG